MFHAHFSSQGAMKQNPGIMPNEFFPTESAADRGAT